MFSGKASVTGAGSSQVSNPRQLPSGGPPASHDESKAPPSTSTTPRTMPPFSPNHRRTTSAPANSPSVLVQNLGSGKASATPVSGSSGSSTVQQSAKVSGRQRRTTANSYRVTPSIEPKDVSGEKISGRSSGSSLKISTPVIQVHSGSHDNVADPASKTEKALISPTTEHGESPQHPTGLPMGFPDDDKYWEEAQRRKSQVPLADVMPQEGAVRPNSGLFSRLRKTSTASAIGTHVNGKEDVQVKMETSTLPRSQKGSSARASTATQSSVHSNESPTSQNHHTKRKIHLLPHKSQKTESPLKDEEETIDIRKLQELALRLEAGIPITKPVHMEFLAHILRLIEKKELRFYEGKQEHMDCGLERATVLRKIPAGTTDKTLFPTPPEPPTKQNSPLALQIASMVPAELLFQMSPSNGTPHSFSRSSSVQKGRRHSYYDPPTTPGGSSLSAMGSIHDDKSRRSSTSDHYAETSPVQYNIPTAPIPEICEDSAATSDISLPYPIPSDSASTSTHSTQSHSSLSTIRLDAVDNSFAAKAVPPVYLPSKLNNVFASTSPSGEFEDCTMTATGSSLKRLLPRTTGTVPVFVYDEAEVCHFFNLSPEKTVHEVLLETLKGSMAEKYWNRYRMIFVDKRSGHVSEKMAYPNTPLDFFLLDPEMKEGKLEEGASCAPLTFRMRRRSTEKFRIVVKVEGKGSRSVVLDVYTTAGDVEKIMHVMEGISDEDTDDWGIFKEYAPKFGLQKILDKGKDAKEHSKQPKYYLLTPSTVIDPWDTTKLFLRRKSNARRKSSGKVQVILGIDSEKEYRKIVVQARQSMVEGKFPRKLSEDLQKSQSTGSLTTIIRGSDPTETIFRPQSSGELFKGSRDVVSRDSKSLTKRGSEGNLSTKGKRSSRQNSLNEKEIADQHRRRNSMDSSFSRWQHHFRMKSSSMEKDIGCLDSPSLTSLRTQSTCKSNAVCRAESKSKKIATFFGVQDKKEELTKIKSILDSNKSADARISFSLKPTFLARFFFANLTYSSLNLPIDIVASNVVPELLTN
ncbi:hypothetical protein BC829DRAFT_138101 [Chytridium lagenaria]|nr:hypothetical protein BC829DRAFT_138101 [Chytridium lagenaria]